VSFEAKSRANLVVNAPIAKENVANDSLSKFWKITYSTIKDLDRGRMKSYDGMLEVSEKDQWLRLMDARGVQIGCRSLQKGDHFSIGAKLFFPIHVVRIGMPAAPVPSRRVCMDHAVLPAVLMRDNASTPSVEDLTAAPREALASKSVSPVVPLQPVSPAVLPSHPVLLKSDKQSTSS
jgi:hypothetical protein